MPSSAPVLDSLFAAWLAGFTDGEGYIDWSGSARLVLTTSHLRTLELIQAQCGGTIRCLPMLRGRVRSRKPTYQLSFGGETARHLLQSILPYLQEKRRQGELVLSVRRRDRGYPLTDDEVLYREDVRRNLKNLRHGRPEQWSSADPARARRVA